MTASRRVPTLRRGILLALSTVGVLIVLLGLVRRRTAPEPNTRVVVGEVCYEHYEDRKAGLSVHAVRAPRAAGAASMNSRHADGKALGLTTVSAQTALPATQGAALAAINGGFFQREGPYAGDARGLQIVEGDLISAPDGGVAFWLDAAGVPRADAVASRLRVTWPGGGSSPVGLNEARPPERLVLYTRALGDSTKTRGGRELILEGADNTVLEPLRPGGHFRVRVRETHESGNAPLRPGTVVLSVGPAALTSVPAVQPGDELGLSTGTEPDLTGVSTAMGGGPVLVRGGRPVRLSASESAAYQFSSMFERHPRSAIGWNNDRVWMVTADGRREGVAEGLTLPELADFLVRLGCQEAMNLDGGGSSTLWFDGKVRNYLCDGYERDVANSLVILHPPDAGAGRPTVSEDPFVSGKVWTVDIELGPEQLEQLRVESRRYVPGTVRFSGLSCGPVGLKLKGHGSFQPIDQKPSFTVDFAAYSPTQSMRGLTKIHLNNSLHDASYLREMLAGEMCRVVGLPVPRLAHGRVQLNGRPLGLYVVKEGYTREFLRRHFRASEGDLYDDNDGHDVDRRLDRDLAAGPDEDQGALQRLAAAAAEPDLDRRWQRLQQTLEIEPFLTFMAMEVMLGHWDGYCQGQNNFRIYVDPDSMRVVFLPSGMDQIFAKADLPWRPEMTGVVARAVMQTPQGKAAYEARFRDLFGRLFDGDPWMRRLEPWLEPLRRELPSAGFEALRAEAAALGEQVAAREKFLRAELLQTGPAVAEFVDGAVRLTGWKPFETPDGGAMREDPGMAPGQGLHIVAGPRTTASWRTTVKLGPGRYRFEGRARAAAVRPLPFGKHHGLALRVAGQDQCSVELTGTTEWQRLTTSFEVPAPGGEVTLICQMRASAGEACFERSSLAVVRER